MVKLMHIILSMSLMGSLCAHAQYEPQAPLTGHGAIHKTDTRIKAWASDAQTNLGWIQITDTTQGKVSSGIPQNAVGPHDYTVISLGDGGSIICTFEHPIINGDGADFVIFENGFLNTLNSSEAFLELAFVEVSSNGIDFVRFPAVSNTQIDTQIINDDYINASQIHNLAGKYIANWGTPFDLNELKDEPNLDVNNITHIRIIDVVGILDEALGTRDNNGHLINDPFPTPFITGGFDLESIGVIYNTQNPTSITPLRQYWKVYPNPVAQNLYLEHTFSQQDNVHIKITDIQGKIVFTAQGIPNTIDVSKWTKGNYLVIIQTNKHVHSGVFVKE